MHVIFVNKALYLNNSLLQYQQAIKKVKIKDYYRLDQLLIYNASKEKYV